VNAKALEGNSAMKHKVRGSTKKYREQKLPCAERERLEQAYQDALQRKLAVEDSLNKEIVSAERSLVRRAKNQLEAAQGHASHILLELLAHERKHGCVGRSLVEPSPTIEKD
jgi:hypothetical protein